MFKNYGLAAIRNIKRYKGFSAINLTGLALGMASCFLIFIWVQDELSYDRYHTHADDLYVVHFQPEGSEDRYTHGPGPLAPALKREFPEIINACRIFGHARAPLKYGDKLFTSRVRGVDPAFFEMFSSPVRQGDAEDPLGDRQAMVLTRETAEKLFSSEDPIGKAVSFEWWGTWHEFRVTAVLEDLPPNSDFQFDLLLPFSFVTLSGMSIVDWDVYGYETYVQLQPGADPDIVTGKISGVMRRNVPDSPLDLKLYPLARLHLYDPRGGGPIVYVYIFSCIAAFIVGIACINFINLTTARSTKRAREVGLRKVVGAKRAQLIRQFLGESFLLTFIALAAALLLTWLLLPAVNYLLDREMVFRLGGGTALLLSGLAVATGLASGIYPAFVLSSFPPSQVLKGPLVAGAKAPSFRKVLVVIQFSISIFLLICTSVMFKQLDYMRHKDMGLNTDQVINMELRGGLRSNFRAIKNRLLQNPDILAVSATNGSYFKRFGTDKVTWEGKDPNERLFVSIHAVDYDYQKIFDLEMSEGRYFSREFPSDEEEAFLINETAAKAMGMESPLGQRIHCPLPFDGDRDGLIVGVVKDFHFRSLHEEIKPLVLAIAPGWFTDMYIRMQTKDLAATVGITEGVLKEMAPDFPLEYTFLDEDLDRLYKKDSRIGALVRYGTMLAVVIACLGLLGLASFTAEQRTKEIGIRKVLGSSVGAIFLLLSRQFSLWILLANLFAWPLAYLALSKWLEGFAYRTRLGIEFFLAAGMATLVVALITVSYQSLKAALANPVDSLRNE
jgi:putative ABC transport system permease protein